MAAKIRAVPAPTGGWNARDSWADMKPNEAVILDNWFPGEGSVKLRKGFSSHVGTLGGWVETLAVYDTGAASQLLAAANGSLWTVTSTNTLLASGFTNDRWYTATLNSVMGLVNGDDAPRTWNGSTLGTMTLTGPTAANVIGINVFKSRSYFWEDDDQSFWYSAVNTMGGTVTEFNLGQTGNIEGELTTMVNWTRDGGDGLDDLAVFIFSSGDVVVYQGSDPGSDFTRVGQYRIGAPVGRRCTMSFGGDVVVITSDGYVSLNEVIRLRTPSVSSMIQEAVRSAVVAHGTRYGWQPAFFPAAHFALFNVPISGAESVQHVINTNTGKWCRFTGINARCWAVWNGLLYFGGNAAVYKAWDGLSDAGTAITADAVPAFNYFGTPKIKQVTAIQPAMKANGALDLAVQTEADFQVRARPTANLSAGSSSSPWGSAWGSPWSAAAMLTTPIKTTTRIGRALSGRLVTRTTQHALEWYSNTYFYEEGGYI